MSWNEPGERQNNEDRDPWNRKDPAGNGPPDLDQVLKNLIHRFKGLFGRKISEDGSGSSNDPQATLGLLGLAGIGILVLWALSGIFVVGAAENAVILRFGRYIETLNPGIHWIPRFIESAYKINTQEISEFPYQAEMLTKDENIVDVALVVQYRVGEPRDFLLKVDDPRQSLQEATASALRQVIGSQTLDAVLTSGRAQIREGVYKQLSQLMTSYQTGLNVTDVTLQPAKPPEAVTSAFDDAIKAREDEQRFINKAQAYANRVEPIAQGQAQRLLQEATAYKSQVVLAAKGNIAGYVAILPAYRQAPSVTRERLYLDAIQSVLENSTKILVDTSGTNNMLYLPLDKIMQNQQTSVIPKRLVSEDEANSNTLFSPVEQTGDRLTVPANGNSNTLRVKRPERGQFVNPDSDAGMGDQS
ncbi:MAG: HflK protein [Gammaproteobacteria bacterium]|nr:HflK protein [Gammaproteobacteria bacterium]